MRLTWQRILLAFMLVFLAGCGSDDSSSSDTEASNDEPTLTEETVTPEEPETDAEGPASKPDIASAGLYLGEIRQGDNTGDSTLLLSFNEDGSAILVEKAPGTYAKGLIEFDETGAFTGDIQEFMGTEVNTGQISGSSTGSSLSGEGLNADGERANTFEFDRVAELSDIETGLPFVAGTWYVAGNTAITTIAADAEGQFSGGDGACMYTGKLSVPDDQVNIYRVLLTVSNCTEDAQPGTYEGLAYRIPEDGADPERLQILADDGEHYEDLVFSRVIMN